MANYILQPRAERDLRGISEFIGDSDFLAAERVINRLVDVFESLGANPLMGYNRQNLADNLRSFPVMGYVIYYFPTDSGVEIARIIHGSRDFGRFP